MFAAVTPVGIVADVGRVIVGWGVTGAGAAARSGAVGV